MQDLNELIHDYDPSKAHAYYLRVRKLKGRKPGATDDIPVAPKGGGRDPSRPEVKGTVVRNPKNSSLKSDSEKRVAELLSRLSTLRAELEKLVAQAKKRSGVETKPAPKAGSSTKSSPSPSSGGDSKAKPLSPSDKKKKAEEEKKRRDKEAKTPAGKLDAKVAEVTSQIQLMQMQLAEAKQKALDSASNTNPAKKAAK